MLNLPTSGAARFAILYSATFTLLIVGLGAMVYLTVRQELRYDLDQRVLTERNAVAREASVSGLARVVGDRARQERGDMRYALLDANGKVVAGREVMVVPGPGWANMSFIKNDGSPDPTRALVTAVAKGRLIVGADPEALESLDERLIPLFAATFGIIAAIGAGGAFILSHALRRRLDTITQTADAISAGDLTRRIVVVGRGGEFERLSATLNRMLDRIAALLENLRQVSSDIAHDLRTPITRLRQKLDLALSRDQDADGLRAAVQQAVEETDEILELFGAILSISEAEAGASIHRQRFNLSLLMNDLADIYQSAAEEDGDRTFTREVVPDVFVEANRGLIAQLTTNLLDNALRHTAPGTPLGLALQTEPTSVLLTIFDGGEGIPACQRDNVFARFTRLDRSRSTPGHGLGLSLVAAIAKAHGGHVRIGDNIPGVKVMVDLPRSAA